MDFADFTGSLEHDAPPPGLSSLLQSLWYEGKGDWDRAHRIAQDESGPDAAWVHAYLHRKEGDPGNAGYWYRRANRRPSTGSLQAEWDGIVRELLGRS